MQSFVARCQYEVNEYRYEKRNGETECCPNEIRMAPSSLSGKGIQHAPRRFNLNSPIAEYLMIKRIVINQNRLVFLNELNSIAKFFD